MKLWQSGGTMTRPTKLAAAATAILLFFSNANQLAWSAEVMTAAEPVAKSGPNRWVTPVNQLLTPAGKTIELPGFRPQALALSPNGKLLVTTGKKSELVVLDPASGEIKQRVALPSDLTTETTEVVSANILMPDKEGQLSFTGLIFSPDGKRLYLANVNGSIKVFGVAKDGKVSGLFSIPLPPANAPRRTSEIPAGLALSGDGKRLYVCGNLTNQLFEIDVATGKVLRTRAVGVAPYDVVLVKDKAYVSNWGGRRPIDNDLTGPAGRGTVVRVDRVRHIASEGSVSVIDLKTEHATRSLEILTGLHASALAVSPDQCHVVVANAGSDTLLVIDTRTEKIVETIWARQRPDDLFGAQPNALAFDKSGKKLYVFNGSQNAVAVIAFKPGKSEWRGLIPVGWFPGAIAFDAKRSQLCVANIKGLPTQTMKAKSAPLITPGLMSGRVTRRRPRRSPARPRPAHDAREARHAARGRPQRAASRPAPSPGAAGGARPARSARSPPRGTRHQPSRPACDRHLDRQRPRESSRARRPSSSPSEIGRAHV